MSSSISSILVGIFAPNSTTQTSQVSNNIQTSDTTQQVAQANQSSGYGPAVIIDISPQALAALNGTGSGAGTSGQSADSLISNLFADLASLFGNAASGSSTGSSSTNGVSATPNVDADSPASSTVSAASGTSGNSTNQTQTASTDPSVSPHHGHHHHHGGGAELASSSTSTSSQDPLASLLGIGNTSSTDGTTSTTSILSTTA